MASTYSNLSIELIGTGDQSGTWGTTTNTNLGTALEEAIVGTVNQAVTAVDLTLPWSTASNATQVARHSRLNLTGSSGGASNLIVPTLSGGKNYYIKNSSTTAVTVKTAAGTGILVPAGKSASLYQDGTNVVEAADYSTSYTIGTLTTTNDATINGLTVGKGLASGSMNTALGVNAMNAITSGNSNTGLGYEALGATTTGIENTAIGDDALLSNTTGSYNTAVGKNALDANLTGGVNTAVGWNSLSANTTGGSNAAVGYLALALNTTASDNTALGREALTANTTGSENTAVGKDALKGNTTAANNTAVGNGASYTGTTAERNTSVGYQALYSNTGNQSTAVGYQAGRDVTTGLYGTYIGYLAGTNVTTGSYNVALGRSALVTNTTGGNNTALGFESLNANTTASNNTAVGYQSLYDNTTGTNLVALGYQALANNTTADGNVAVGYQALLANTTGIMNTAIGYVALDSNTTGSYNVAIGRQALEANTTSSYSIAIGTAALSSSTGQSNTALGYSAGSTLTTGTNNTLLGYDAEPSSATVSNEVTIGNDSVTVTRLKGNVGIGTSSPSQLLHINSTGAIKTRLQRSSNYSDISIGVSGELNFDNLSSNGFGWYINSSEKMRITSTGNVGIGTSSPSSKLEVNGTITIGTGTGTYQAGVLGFSDVNFGFGYRPPRAGLIAAHSFQTFNGTRILEVTESGNVGIGTSSPTYKLQIQSGASTILAGADSGATTLTNATQKVMRFGVPHYTNAEEPVCGLFVSNLSTSNEILIGGGTGQLNAATLLQFYTAANNTTLTGTERMRIDSSGNVLVGTTSATIVYTGATSYTSSIISKSGYDQLTLLSPNVNPTLSWAQPNSSAINYRYASIRGVMTTTTAGSEAGSLTFLTSNAGAASVEHMRIGAGGDVLIGTTDINPPSSNVQGAAFRSNTGALLINADGAHGLAVGRKQDGVLVYFYSAGTIEGNISVSGTTVSYNGGHLARLTQLPNSTKDETILKGTVLSNLDDMCVYVNAETDETADNEQLNKVKVSDVEGDPNVAGVYVSWIYDEQHDVEEINMAMTGDMIIRIAQGVTVNRGDLLMSAGNGTAKPQGDDIVRSKTIAKVTSTSVTCTYEDGSYCVPCVLMAC
jgi:hypothetical protein